MINVHGNYWRPSEGYQYITNGEIYTDSIYLGAADRIENWHDTNEQPPEEVSVFDDVSADEAMEILFGGDAG